MYFTALAGVLDARDGTVSYCQAGHPSLAYFDPAAGWIELQDSGFPVGLLDDAQYERKQLQLHAGAILLAVSDGFLRPRPGDPGGGSEVLRVLPRAPRHAEDLIEPLNQFAAQVQGCERDDQSAMVIGRLP